MNFLTKKENDLANKFKLNGYLIINVESKNSLNYIYNIIIKATKDYLNTKKKINLNYIHKIISVDDLNNFRLKIINSINNDKLARYHYFNLGKECIYSLVGNELMMQKSINLSIQFPNDSSSLLPIHSDVWSGDSPYTINLWLPLVDCYKTKSMYILEQKNYDFFKKIVKKKKITSSSEIFDKLKNKIKWLKVNYGQFLIFNQSLPHGNVVNKEKQTRWSMNCRFKTIFSPYEDKKIGEFFLPITTRAITEVGMNYKSPFGKIK
jgi:sporadic carbohydrate cluster 2OG-Fe(II) oxygenase